MGTAPGRAPRAHRAPCTPTRAQVDDTPLPAPAHDAHTAVLRRIVEECTKGEDTTIHLEGWGLNGGTTPRMVVEQGVNSA